MVREQSFSRKSWIAYLPNEQSLGLNVRSNGSAQLCAFALSFTDDGDFCRSLYAITTGYKDMFRNLFGRIRMRVAGRLAIVAAAALFGAAPASASLILDSLHYDGDVRNGATVGIEKHFADFSPDVAPPAGFGDLPADNSMLPNPLVDGAALTAGITEFLDALDGEVLQHSIVTINRAGVGDIFNNALDSNIALPVNFDGLFYSNSIGANQKVAIAAVQIEQIPAAGTPPFPAPGSQVFSGKGTQADPLRVQLGIAASQVASRNGAVKIHLYHSLMRAPEIPEPTSAILALVGVVGLASVTRRR